MNQTNAAFLLFHPFPVQSYPGDHRGTYHSLLHAFHLLLLAGSRRRRRRRHRRAAAAFRRRGDAAGGGRRATRRRPCARFVRRRPMSSVKALLVLALLI